MNKMNVEEEFDFFEIDQHNLDREWVEQPSLYFKWAKQLADAREDVERAKAELDLVKAELNRSIRNDPEEYGLSKVTEAAVSAAIPEQREYTEASEALMEAKHKADVLQAVVVALDHRKRALEKLVDLHGQNYFSSPRAPDTQTAEAMEEATKKHVRGRGKTKRNK